MLAPVVRSQDYDAEGQIKVPLSRTLEKPFGVESIVDGNTLQLTDGKTVRLAGVDVVKPGLTTHNELLGKKNDLAAEKIKVFANKSVWFIEQFVFETRSSMFLSDSDKDESRPRKIRLEYENEADSQKSKRPPWVYVYVTLPVYDNPNISSPQAADLEDALASETREVMLNGEMIKEGYGFVRHQNPCKYRKEFEQLQNIARVNRRGIWGEG
ncbi:MAG: thermonuclease family protein [Candidatus Omnitrophica bacterium]|nr:thermonuclease family protein [Candidatus Omnitrophota bacterium]MDD5670465.1 thermonuclease family protein [Candidatus Omnitrophota bacterium]